MIAALTLMTEQRDTQLEGLTMRLTKEQIEARLNELIDEVVEAERDYANTEGFSRRYAHQDYEETRKRVMDTLMEIYIG